MKRHQNKLGSMGIIASLFIAVSDLSALTVAWRGVQVVPISNMGLIILSILLMGISTLFILKSKTQTQKFLMIAFLVVGFFSFTKEAVAAVMGYQIIIESANGSEQITTITGPTTVDVRNDYADSVIITTIDDEGCSITMSGGDCEVGDVLLNGDTCTVDIECPYDV